MSAIIMDTPFEEEFEEYQEVYYEFYNDDMVAPQENRKELLSFVHQFSEKNYRMIEICGLRFYQLKGNRIEDLSEAFFERHIKQGSTVIDYGAQSGLHALLFSQLVGLEGRLIAFESNMQRFKELFWNMMLNQVQNAQLYCMTLGKQAHTLDALELKDVSLIRINTEGDIEAFLKGARKTIEECKPILVIKMIGGIPIERADKYVKQVFLDQMEEIQKMGYITERINEGEYLALPNERKFPAA